MGCQTLKKDYAQLAAIRAVECCDSCHDDFEQGFDDLIELYAKNGEVYWVCCRVLSTCQRYPDYFESNGYG